MARALDVLTRLDLMPRSLAVRRRGDHWRGVLRVEAPGPLVALCVKRLRNQVKLRAVVVRGRDGSETLEGAADKTSPSPG
jgi:hypothetical protein